MSRVSLAELSGAILELYQSLLGQREFEHVQSSNTYLGMRILLLRSIADAVRPAESLTSVEGCMLMDTILDSIALEAASGAQRTPFDLPRICDSSLIGPAKDRRARMKGTSKEFSDWQFQVLVQAYAATHGYGPVRDLKYSANSKGSRVCDFLIDRDASGPELIECKRFHPEKKVSKPIDEVISKIRSRLPGVADQLHQSALAFGLEDACRHLIVEISAYCYVCNEFRHTRLNGSVCGFTSNQIDSIVEFLPTNLQQLEQRIDKISLCWRNTIFVDGLPCAIVQFRRAIVVDGVHSSFDFQGWTVEAYPVRASPYREIRVAASPRTLDWILTTFANLRSPESFYTVTAPKHSSE